MDKKLLDSLSNLSLALEDIAAALKDKSEAQSATAKAMKGGDFVKEIKEINVGVKALQKDSKQILANQQTIMNMAKSKGDKKENVAENLGKDKNAQKNFKEGLGVILLIAVAVLAIGVAFNLVGKVNFLSVIALSIALPLLAIGFAKVHKILKEVGFDPKKDARNFIIAITAISVGLTASSWILSMITPLSFSKFFTATFIALTFAMLGPSIYKFLMAFKEMSWGQLIKSVAGFALILPAIALGIAFASWAFQLIKPIGFSQFLTAVGIGIVFAIISFGIRKLLKAFKGVGVKDLMEAVIFLPLILPAIALGIAGASWALQLVKPIGFAQFLTTIFIALAFTVIAFGLNKMLSAFKGLTPVQLLIAAASLPVLLVAISYAIALSSIAFSKIKVIGFTQFLTAIGIAAVFVVLSYGIAKIVNGIRRMNYSDLPKIPVFMVLVAIAITASSYILAMAKTIPAATLFKLVLYGLALAVVAAAIGGVMALFGKMKVGIKDALMGTLLIVVIAVAVMVSSHILALGNYKKYPDWKWALGVGLSLIAFTPAIVLLGAIAMSGVGALAILAGAGMILVVAAAIMATSHILGMGKYNKFPPILWTLGVVAVMVPFSMILGVLGAIAVTGIGAVALLLGAAMILVVAQTIVETASILSKGKYGNYPGFGWALGVGLSMTGFGTAMLVLGTLILGSFGLGYLALEAGGEAVKLIAETIVSAAYILNKGNFTGGPTKEWAEGIAIALGAFSPIYMMLMNSGILSIFGGGGVSPKDFAVAIMTVSQGIVDAAGFFANNKAAFVKGPTKAWSEGVGLAIGAFAPVYKMLEDFPFTGGQKMSKAIVTITRGIIDSANIFAKNKSTFDEGYPSKSWGEGVGAALGAFAPVFKALHEDTGWFTSGDDVIRNMQNAIVTISWSLVDAASAFSSAGPDAWNAYPTAAWADGVKNSITNFIDVYKSLSESDTDPSDLGLITRYATQMAYTAAILGRNKKYFDTQIDPNFVKKMSKNILDYQNLVNSMSGYKSSSFASMMGLDPVQRVANGMVKIASAYDKLAKAIKNFSSALNGLDPIRVRSFTMLTGNIAMLSALDSTMFSNMLKVLESRSGVFAKMLQVQTSEISKRPVVKAGPGVGGAVQSKKSDESYYKDSKGETQLQKLDKMIYLLKGLRDEAQGINSFLHDPKATNQDMGSKGDG
jgi:hypothetical protein